MSDDYRNRGYTHFLSFCLLLHFSFVSQATYLKKQCNITSDLWKCWKLCQSLDESQKKREGKRWKAKLHWRSLFRTSNRQCFSQQSAGLQGDRVVISWQRGAGHVGTTRPTSKTPDLENTDSTHTLSVSVCDISLFLSASFCADFTHLSSPLLSLAHTYIWLNYRIQYFFYVQ